ncbi:MAG: phosphoribosylglycinamide formyltransferase [Lachnospiraceae bacterium]|jgi:phosphoribosylglycinamide formyltransferase-1
MLKIGVMVSGGGTNLQAIIDAIETGKITNTEIRVVISNNQNAYALERAKKAGIEAVCLSPKDFPDRGAFNEAFLEKVEEYDLDLIVLAGFLVTIPAAMIEKYRSRIINIHPSLIPSFCGVGYYGLKVHEAALKRGVKVTGATVHYVDEGVDSGPIILQKAVEVKEGDTPEILQRRVMEEAEWIILPQAINMIANQ